MNVIQVTLGDIIEATYSTLAERFGDRELASLTAQTLVAELLGEDDDGERAAAA